MITRDLFVFSAVGYLLFSVAVFCLLAAHVLLEETVVKPAWKTFYKWLTNLGNISFSLYASHALILQFFPFSLFENVGVGLKFWPFGGYIIASIFVAILIYQVAEKPFVKSRRVAKV